MERENLTEDLIDYLIRCPKEITNSNAELFIENVRKQQNYRAISINNPRFVFEIYKRQNLNIDMEHDFSCGISVVTQEDKKITLKRYNGAHIHYNSLEGTKLESKTHIHIATERYIKANKKPESFAETTERYTNLEEAFECLISDCNIKL